jgi:type IV pilus assembly protein PilC
MAQSSTAIRQIKRDIPFVWEGKDKRGNTVKGKSLASTEQALRAELRRQGVAATRVKKQSSAFKSGGKVKPEDIAVFSRQLATMLAAGIPLVQAFEIVGNGHEKPSMQKLILDIKADVEGGTSLHESLAKRPLYFDDLYVNLVEAGEQAGALEGLLDKIATYKEKTEALKKKVKKALFYPTAVLVVAVIVTVILLIFVIPQFESLFKGFGAELPAFTQMVINLSRFLQAKGIFIAVVLVGAGYAFFYFKKRSRKMRQFLDRISLKVPIIGPILNKAAIARFARTLSTMFAAGVPLVEALDSVAGATGNIVYEDAVMKMKDEVATGQRLQRAMENTSLFPNMVIQMIAVGEEAGALDAMSGKVASFYEAEVDNAVDSMSSLLEPLIMAILGGLMIDQLAGSGAVFIGVCALLGLLIGSFLNVVIHRLPLMLDRQWRRQCLELDGKAEADGVPAFNLVTPRSACPGCKAPITALQNIPVVSYLFLRGRCAGCGKRISARYPLVELLTAVASGIVAWKFGYGASAAAALLLTWFLIALTFIDVDHQLLPDNLTLPLLWLGVLASLVLPEAAGLPVPVDLRSSVIGAILGYVSLWSVYQAFRLLTGKEGMGYGDFKLLAALGAWLGFKMLLPIVLMAAAVGAIVGTALILRGRQERGVPMAFGPFLAAAGWLALLFGHEMVDRYLSLYPGH